MAASALLSSSPAGMRRGGPVVVISSSPEFPSICDLLPKAPRQTSLRSGSKAAPIPQDAPSAFTSAASVWRSSRLDQGPGIDASGTCSVLMAKIQKGSFAPTVELSPEISTEHNGRMKEQPRHMTTASGEKRPGNSSSRRSVEEVSAQDLSADLPRSNGPGRKGNSTKDAGKSQSTLPKGKVTKAAAKDVTSRRKKTETVSRHFTTQPSAPQPARKPTVDFSGAEPLVLEPAMRRRVDWTPPRESAPPQHTADSSAAKEISSSLAERGGLRGDVFGNIQDAYARKAGADDKAGDHVTGFANTDVLGKRKLIEMVATSGSKQRTPEASPTKPKAQKKKPRTITELATAAYRLPEEQDSVTSADGPHPNSLLNYLETTGEQSAGATKASAIKGKGAKMPMKPKPLKKKEEARKPVLLSPTSALRQVGKQDFVFGTASQLATEDDPELLRALHEAMKVSNQADIDPFASPNHVNSNLAIRRRPGPGLWAAGARDDDGDVLDLEMLDLTRSSPLPQDFILTNASRARGEASVKQSPRPKICIEIQSDDNLDIPESTAMADPKLSLCTSRRLISQTKDNAENSATGNNAQDRAPTAWAIEPDLELPPSNQEQHQLLQSQSNSPRQGGEAEMPARPNFELYTDAQLAKEVASYGFKAVKRRTAMIALLDQCWASQNNNSLGNRTAKASLSSSSAKGGASPSRPRGRPRKISDTSAPDAGAPTRTGKGGRGKPVSSAEPGMAAPLVEKRPRGRPKKDTSASGAGASGTGEGGGRRGSVSSAEPDIPLPLVEKRPRGRPKKDASAAMSQPSKAKAPGSPKRAKSPTKSAAPTPTTPHRRRKKPAESVLEIPDSDLDDPFASSAASSPDKQDVFSSPPQMDLSVTEDTEASLVASPTSQQVALFRHITQAVVSAPRTRDPADPSWHDKMLMYDPVILEDLTAWLNAGQLDKVGYDGEVSPGDVKKWCESKSVCCLWRVNLHGKERKRF